jgi:hypothetical protein
MITSAQWKAIEMGLCFLLHGLKSVVITAYNMLWAHQPRHKILKWCFVSGCMDREVLESEQIMCCDRINLMESYLNGTIFLVAWTNIFHWRVWIGLKICKESIGNISYIGESLKKNRSSDFLNDKYHHVMIQSWLADFTTLHLVHVWLVEFWGVCKHD